MDIHTKKFWFAIGLEAMCIVGIAIGQIDYMTGLEWMMTAGVAWGLLDTVVKFTNKKEK
jgi:hypothetical protein